MVFHEEYERRNTGRVAFGKHRLNWLRYLWRERTPINSRGRSATLGKADSKSPERCHSNLAPPSISGSFFPLFWLHPQMGFLSLETAICMDLASLADVIIWLVIPENIPGFVCLTLIRLHVQSYTSSQHWWGPGWIWRWRSSSLTSQYWCPSFKIQGLSGITFEELKQWRSFHSGARLPLYFKGVHSFSCLLIYHKVSRTKAESICFWLSTDTLTILWIMFNKCFIESTTR